MREFAHIVIIISKQKKSRAFKCPHCKNKIVKRTSPIAKNLLYCTESEASEIENIYAEIQK